MQIFEQHLGVVEAIEEGNYMVRYWELMIPAKDTAAAADSEQTAMLTSIRRRALTPRLVAVSKPASIAL